MLGGTINLFIVILLILFPIVLLFLLFFYNLFSRVSKRYQQKVFLQFVKELEDHYVVLVRTIDPSGRPDSGLRLFFVNQKRTSEEDKYIEIVVPFR